MDEIPKHDVVIVAGDLNARIGADNTGHEKVMGRHGEGEMNNNGERFVNFCEENRMVIGGSVFQHKKIHKLTWTSPDGRTQTQIDHIAINTKWRRSMRDVRVKRHADAGSDHNLLIAEVALKLKKVKLGEKRKTRLDSGRLQDPETRKSFHLELQNRFSALEAKADISMTDFNMVMREAGEKVLGHKKRPKEEWISQDTWAKISERKKIKARVLNTKSPRLLERVQKEYRQKDKEVKRSARQDKRAYVEKLAEAAEVAARRKDFKTVYKISKKLSGRDGHQLDVPVKDRTGGIITGEREKVERWREHFSNILNRPEPVRTTQIREAQKDLEVDTTEIKIEEVREAVKSLKSGKSPGEDGIDAQMLTAGGETTVRALHQVLSEIWDKEQAPVEWHTGLIVRLPKKGDLGDCNNWRGITLLPVTLKVFCKILLNRLKRATEKVLRKEQAGFRSGKSCTDQIFTLRQILEQCTEWNSTVYINFVDFEKAFDSLHRPSLWKILRYHGIPLKIVNTIKMLYSDPQCKVICGSCTTESFSVTTGVKQGCLLSPLLFILAMDWIMRETTADKKRGLRWTLTTVLEDLDYADDVALLSSKHQDMQEKTNKFSVTSETVGLKVNISKTKCMKVNSKREESIKVASTPIEEVTEFDYLGSRMTKDGDAEKDVMVRLGKARFAFASLNSIWRAKNISTQTKLRLFKSNVLSVLLYGAESWKMTTRINTKLETFQSRCLRRILGIYWHDKVTNEEVRKRAGCKTVVKEVKIKRWKWLGHVCRMEKEAIPRTALRWTPEGKRKRGRPKETWRRTVEKELKEQHLTWESLNKETANREQWRELVAALCTLRCEED